MYRSLSLLSLVLAMGACATGDGSAGLDASDPGGPDGGAPDAAVKVDAAANDAAAPDGGLAQPDAVVADAAANDAAADAMVDAAPADAMVDAAPADAMADAAPDAAPDACVPDWIGLLDNGDFEQGATVWTQTGGTLIREYGDGYPWMPHDGSSWAALFGGVNNADHLLTQTVTVPASATALRLRGALCFVTEETTDSVEYDTLTVQVQGAVTEEHVFSNLDADDTCGWTLFQLDAPTSHAGETVTLSLHGQTDISSITSFGLDTLVLEALACP
jgi:hypothetical protein